MKNKHNSGKTIACTQCNQVFNIKHAYNSDGGFVVLCDEHLEQFKQNITETHKQMKRFLWLMLLAAVDLFYGGYLMYDGEVLKACVFIAFGAFFAFTANMWSKEIL